MTEQQKRQATIDQEVEQEQANDSANKPQSNAEDREHMETDAVRPEEDNGAELAQLENDLAEQRKLADENHQRYLRTQADFDNFRRRSRQEKEEFAKYASSALIEQLLPVIDNFERAIVTSKETRDFDGLMKGVDMIFRQFEHVLSQEGLKKIESVGQPFNPEYHQAIAQVESEEHEEGTVVEELQSGYMLKEKVLRPAMVKVSS